MAARTPGDAFGIVETHLGTRTFMVAERPTSADISLRGHLFFPVEESDYPVEGRYPGMQAWLQRIRNIPGWADPYDILPGERNAVRW